jgi:hypothetical protein
MIFPIIPEAGCCKLATLHWNCSLLVQYFHSRSNPSLHSLFLKNLVEASLQNDIGSKPRHYVEAEYYGQDINTSNTELTWFVY